MKLIPERFFLVVNRKQARLDQPLAKNMMRQRNGFADNAKELAVQGHFALGYQRHWSVPEEVGKKLGNTSR